MSSVFFLSSCYSYKIFPKENRRFSYNGQKEDAFILNPELTKELKIFKAAEIFNIVEDTLNQACVKIKLYPLKRDFICGEPIVASLFTLGQLPVLLPDNYQFEFDEVRPTDTTQRKFELKIATRYWFWDMFVVKKNFKKKAGRALLAEYYTKN
jgi:hypothetical protein